MNLQIVLYCGLLLNGNYGLKRPAVELDFAMRGAKYRSCGKVKVIL
jgi:hypothetical protein